MNVVVFGATGMVGAGVVHTCLEDERVASVLIIGRSSAGFDHAKVRELLVPGLFDLGSTEEWLSGLDACFFCAGVSAVGKSEAEYRRLTLDMTLSVAATLRARSPGITFCYVSGAGTDGSASGRVMWARVKGETENRLLAMGFERAYMFRPGYIQPMRGVRSKTLLYRVAYAIIGPLYPLLRRMAPSRVTSSEELGRAMIRVAARGAETPILEGRDINRLGAA